MSVLPSSAEFKPGIQGLRAIAVSLVLIYHIWPAAVPGGYVGVDVFFVISGYLITRLLFNEIKISGRVDLATFYARRVRRLLPAAAVVLIAVAVCVPLLPGSRWHETAIGVAASSLYVQNWWLAQQSIDYLAADSAPSILKHFWSLSVEEQYYIVWPIICSLAALLSLRHGSSSRKYLLVLLAGIFVISLAHSIHLTNTNPGVAYFATTTRVWELALGGMLAIKGVPLWAKSRGLREGTLLLGIGMIILAALAFDGSTAFPGWIALLPTGGAAMVLAATGTSSRSSLDALLSSGVFQYLGGISYSLYLWHWPVVVVYGVLAGRDIGWIDGVVVVVISTALAHQTKELVEDRFRSPPAKGIRKGAIIVALVSIVATLLAAGAIYVAARPAGLKSGEVRYAEYPGARVIIDGAALSPSPGPVVPAPREAHLDRSDAYGRCIAANGVSEPLECKYGNADAEFHVVVVGDSHAVHWFPMFQALAKEKSWRVTGISKTACSFGDQAIQAKAGHEAFDCTTWSARTLISLLDDPPDLVVSAQSIAHLAIGTSDKKESAHKIAAGLSSSWNLLTGAGSKIVVIKDTPWMGRNVPDCMSRPGAVVRDCTRARIRAVGFRDDPLVLAAAKTPGSTLVDVNDAICGPKTCEVVVGNVMVWRDSHHLTATFARTFSSFFGNVIDDVMSGSAPEVVRVDPKDRWNRAAVQESVASTVQERPTDQIDGAGSTTSALDEFDPGLEHSVEYDRMGRTIHGAPQRQVFVLVKAPVEAVIDGLERTMQRKGYRIYRSKQTPRGVRIDYEMAGRPVISALVRPMEANSKLRARGLTASIYLTEILEPTAAE